jgi:hypothetical protein
MKKTIIYIVAICVAFMLLLTSSATLTSCGEPIPPNPDQDSINKANSSYISCYINGKPWETCGKIGLPSPYKIQWFQGGYMDVTGLDYCETFTSNNTDIYIKIPDFHQADSFTVLEDRASCIFNTIEGYKTQDDAIGFINITRIDTIGRYLYGTFGFDVYNEENDSTVRLDQGIINKIRYTKL